MQSSSPASPFSSEQSNFLAGVVLGAEVARHSLNLPLLSGSGGPDAASPGAQLIRGNASKPPIQQQNTCGPDQVLVQAHQRARIKGQLSNEELSKQRFHPLDHFPIVLQGNFESEDAKRVARYYGVHIDSDSNTCSCRFKLIGGRMRSWQLRGVAALADSYGSRKLKINGHGDFEICGIKHINVGPVVEQLLELGLSPLGASGDTCRSIQCTPLSGVDSSEAADVRPLAQQLHHVLQHQRDIFCLPHKFRIGIDGGGQHPLDLRYFDLGLRAIKPTTSSMPVMYRMSLGGIRSLTKIALDTGLELAQSQVIPVVLEILRVYSSLGNRIQRDQGRLAFLLQEMGMDAFLEVVRMRLHQPWPHCTSASPTTSHPLTKRCTGWIVQKQNHLCSFPISLPKRMLTSQQCYVIANLAQQCGTAEIRVANDGTIYLLGLRKETHGVVEQELTRHQLLSRINPIATASH